MPVFIIGVLTMFVFLFIIITSFLRPPSTTPELIETEEAELIAEHTNLKGPVQPKITIVGFTDFGCPACKTYHSVMNDLFKQYPEHIKWAVRHFPLPTHKNADQAAKAAQAAGRQGRFWEFSEILYDNSEDYLEGNFVRYADLLDMNLEQFRQDYNSSEIAREVQEDVSYGTGLGIDSTPLFFLNGRQMNVLGSQDFKEQIEQALRNYNVAVEEIKEQTEIEEEIQEQQTLTSVFTLIDQTYGVREIEFVEGNFKPKNTSAYAGQLIRWVNNSEEDITFVQIMKRYESLKEPFVIKAGETFEFRLELRETGMWTYKSEGNTIRASIMVSKLPQNILNMVPQKENPYPWLD